VNHPEVAILGIAKSREEAVVRNGRIEARLMMPLCLSYDHRVIDGADGARFTQKLVQSLENPERMLLGG
jgi:pyruvate dehydrogenase E2 component (dihydrolipoamide acetyltransferase)